MDAPPSSPRTPRAALLLVAAGMLCSLLGLLLAVGVGRTLHPLLAADGADVVLVVSGVALASSGLFPVVLARLAARDVR